MSDADFARLHEDQATPTISEELSSDTEDDVDIDALLFAAEVSLSQKAPEPSISQQQQKQLQTGYTQGYKSTLIKKQDGVYRLDPKVLLAQNARQASAISAEKVCCVSILWRETQVWCTI